MTNKLIKALLLLGMMAVSSASAALILNINPTDKTYAFTGSDTGSSGAPTFVQWETYVPVIAGVTGFTVGSAGVTSNPNNFTGNQFWVNSDGSTYAAFVIQLNWSAPVVSETITGTGVYQSYASLGPSQQSLFEETNGHTFTTGWGTFSSIVVVPELTTVMLLAIGGGVAWLVRVKLRA